MKLPAYPEYKPSGIEWLGDVPDHWAVKPLKRSVNFIEGPGILATDFVDEGIPLIRIAGIGKRIASLEGCNFLAPDLVDRRWAHFRVQLGDLLISGSASMGFCSEVDQETVGAIPYTGIMITRPKPVWVDKRFIRWFFLSDQFLDQAELAKTGSTIQHFGPTHLSRMIMLLPPPADQRAVADFLDAETSKLDTLVAKKRELIEKLKEKRSALISRTVTRGLPPEAARAAGLNPNPKLKPSGIEWLGEIPEHWSTPSLYTRYTIELGKMLDESRITGEHLVPYLRNVDVQWDTINTSDLPEMDIREDEYSRYTLRVGDLLVCEGGEVGRAAIFQESGLVLGFQKAIHRLRAIDSTELSRFLYYTLYWAAHFGIFLAEGNPNTIPHLTGEKLRRYRFPKPPPSEQRAIADYLDRETNKIDRMVAKVEDAIERLQEYRTALITAAVTGKIDVRELPA